LKVAKVSKTDNQIVDMLNNYGFQGESLLIVGPGGHGKTHSVKDYAIKNELTFVDAQGHSEMDALELFGFDKMYGDQMVWFDGPVSEAALLASKGNKTILFIDEFTNIPLKEAASLKACFEPYNGYYYFHTGKINEIIDGRAKKEIIKVPVENLQIVAAANMGSGYATEEIDKALKQRFLIAYYEASDLKIEKVLKSICAKKGFSLELVSKLMKFKSATEESAKQGLISEPAVLRHLSRKILGLMKSEDELEDVALTQVNQWIDFDVDGKPVEQQLEIIEDIISATLE
jgi:MoxR-like ATPase